MARNGLAAFALTWVLVTGGHGLVAADLKYPFLESSLNGTVKSQKGEPLEGILIRAKKENTNVSRVVVSDAQGHYRFPKLEPGRYTVEIARADGLEAGPRVLQLQDGRDQPVEFTLAPAKVMDQHMTAVDWLRSLPGTPEQVKLIADNCIHCHTGNLQNFRFDKDNWLKMIRFMRTKIIHGAEWGAIHHEPAPGAQPEKDQPGWDEENQVMADFLAKVRGPQPIDLSNAKILQRPTGRSTRMMITEYEIPYHDAELHDIDVDKYGMVWWTDWRWPYVGMLNPETGQMKYWESPVPEGKPEMHPGGQEISFDKDENLWTVIAWTGGLLKFDRKTEKFSSYTFPDRGPRRFLSVGTDPSRDRVWFHTDNYYGTYYSGFLVPDKRQWTIYEMPLKAGKKASGIYGDVNDTKGNRYLMMHRDSDIGWINPETGELTRYPTPTPNAFPRRGDYDSKDRVWFSEYNAGQIGMFDPTTRKITEYKIPDVPMALPYGCGVDRNTDRVWVELYRNDRLVMLEPKTGETTQYLLPELHVMARSPRAATASTADHSIIYLGTLPKFGNGKIYKIETW